MADPCLNLMRAKALYTLRAKCALAGIALHITEDDRGRPEYIVSQWSLTRSFNSVEELAAWVDRVTGGRSA